MPLFDRANRMMIRNLKAIKELRQGPISRRMTPFGPRTSGSRRLADLPPVKFRTIACSCPDRGQLACGQGVPVYEIDKRCTVCVRRSRPCLAEPPAESPSTMYSSRYCGSRSEQWASFPLRNQLKQRSDRHLVSRGSRVSTMQEGLWTRLPNPRRPGKTLRFHAIIGEQCRKVSL
jgi:hypothetical protein